MPVAATPQNYVDVELFEEMDEPCEVAITLNGKPPTSMRVIRDEDDGGGHTTVWRVFV